MKKIQLALLLLLYLSIIGFSQTNTFVIKVIDSKGLKDSVIMGYRDNATIGIDPSLNESDYFGQPDSELDIRSIQRNTITKDGFWLFSLNGGFLVFPFANNVDLKKDFREYAMIEHFIVQVQAKNYPVTVKISYLNFQQTIPYCFYSKTNESDFIDGAELHNLLNTKLTDIIVVFNNATENKLIGFHPQTITKVIEHSKNDIDLKLYPNPASNVLFIKSSSAKVENVVVIDCKGVEMAKFQMQNNSMELNISHYPNGIYFIQIGSTVSKFIKQ